MKKVSLCFLITSCFLYGKINFSINGDFSNFYASRTSDNSILNIPFKLANINSTLYFKSFELHLNHAIEYKKINDDNLFSSENITSNIREFYGTLYFNLAEFSFGKQLFTLGSVDENSPIDHFNPYNYYYLLIGGSDKKVPIEALSFELYLDLIKVSGAFSATHNQNFYPQDDPEYSLSLPYFPETYEFLDNKGSQHESFLSLQFAPNYNTDITLTYLRAFDRVFSLSGFTMYEFQGNNVLIPYTLDKWFSNRLTEAINIGTVLLFDDFTIRTDLAFFHSFDRYNRKDYLELKSNFGYVNGISEFYEELYDQMDIDGDGIYDPFNAALQEDAKYSQFTFQFELPLPNDYQINLQYFNYSLIDYHINNYTFSDVSVVLPLATIDLNDVLNDEGDFFNPGIGSSMANLTSESILFSADKLLLDNNLKLTLTTFFDLDKGNGKLVSFESEYSISDNLNILFGSTKIFGDDSVESESEFDPGYTFNLMEDFSHNRLQLQYFF